MVGYDAGFVVRCYGRFGVGFVVGYGVGAVASYGAGYGAGRGLGFVVGCFVGFGVGHGQTGTMPTAGKTNCIFKNYAEAPDHGKGTKSFSLFWAFRYNSKQQTERTRSILCCFHVSDFVRSAEQTNLYTVVYEGPEQLELINIIFKKPELYIYILL